MSGVGLVCKVVLCADFEEIGAEGNGTQRLVAGRLKYRIFGLGIVCEVVFRAEVDGAGAPEKCTEMISSGL